MGFIWWPQNQDRGAVSGPYTTDVVASYLGDAKLDSYDAGDSPAATYTGDSVGQAE